MVLWNTTAASFRLSCSHIRPLPYVCSAGAAAVFQPGCKTIRILLIFNDLRKVVFRALKDRVLADERWLFTRQKAVSWPGLQLWWNG